IKEILIAWGPQHLAKGVERGLKEVDKVIVGWPVQPSLLGNLGLAALGAIGAFIAPKPFDEVLAIYGGHHSTTLWDYAEAAMTPAAALRMQSGGAGLTYIPTTGQMVPTRPGLGATVRYAPEQRVVTAPKFIPGVLRPKYQHGA
ncbi:hypothetical protein MUP79_04050, partial [Candidatus Bathyarchaeota archaeon]|nr:hypothetical protein [Candidatus Bathyarchaeota archaeon]